MRERPILFSGPMVRALLQGRKTQTRRVVKREHLPFVENLQRGFLEGRWNDRPLPYGKPGDRLWVRETWAVGMCADTLAPRELSPRTWLQANGGLWYPANDAQPTSPISPRGKTRVSIHMPRWASRITLEIVSVRVERLNSISEEDAKAEGIEVDSCGHAIRPDDDVNWGGTVSAFCELWESINGQDSWGKNPWVWVIEFKVTKEQKHEQQI